MVIQRLLDVRKRLKDPPKSGPVSIVVTDIQGFSGQSTHAVITTPPMQFRPCTTLPGIPVCTAFPCALIIQRPCADMMKASSDLMMPALITHNNLLQKAKWANFGYTIEQEGDSYSIMFHEASDAVKFCLQAGVRCVGWRTVDSGRFRVRIPDLIDTAIVTGPTAPS